MHSGTPIAFDNSRASSAIRRSRRHRREQAVGRVFRIGLQARRQATGQDLAAEPSEARAWLIQ